MSIGDSKITVQHILTHPDAYFRISKDEIIVIINKTVPILQEIRLHKCECKDESKLGVNSLPESLMRIPSKNSPILKFENNQKPGDIINMLMEVHHYVGIIAINKPECPDSRIEPAIG